MQPSSSEQAAFLPDSGTFVHFEHVNLRVPCHRLATLFFLEGLGLTRDPFERVGTSNMWVNVGNQQFHLPLGEALPFCGEIGLVVPNLPQVVSNLQRMDKPAGTELDLIEEPAGWLAISPWGHRIRLMQGGAPFQFADSLNTSPSMPPLGLAYVLLQVPPGSAAGIAAFYQTQLQCPATLLSTNGSKGMEPTAQVSVGPRQRFYFTETTDANILAQLEHPHPNHVAVYASAYQSLYQRLEQAGLIMETHANQQFRFQDMIDPTTGKHLLRLEHEVRSLYHPEFRKPLLNRNWTGIPFSTRQWATQ